MRTKSLPREAERATGKGLHAGHGPLAELAGRQHGVVSLAQLTSRLGYSPSAVTRAATTGRLHRLYRGVYAVGHTNLSPHGRCLAAVLSYGPNALLSHYSAAWLWGIARWSPIPVSVTVPSPRARRPPIRLHHARALTPADRDEMDRIPVTSVPRTALDLAAKLRARQLMRLLERAEELRLFDLASPLYSLRHRAPASRAVRFAIELDLYETHGSLRHLRTIACARRT